MSIINYQSHTSGVILPSFRQGDRFTTYPFTTKNTVISPNFLMRKLCGKAQFPHSFGRFAQNFAETLPFHKISIPGNQVKIWYFSQCFLPQKELPKSFFRL